MSTPLGALYGSPSRQTTALRGICKPGQWYGGMGRVIGGGTREGQGPVGGRPAGVVGEDPGRPRAALDQGGPAGQRAHRRWLAADREVQPGGLRQPAYVADQMPRSGT